MHCILLWRNVDSLSSKAVLRCCFAVIQMLALVLSLDVPIAKRYIKWWLFLFMLQGDMNVCIIWGRMYNQSDSNLNKKISSSGQCLVKASKNTIWKKKKKRKRQVLVILVDLMYNSFAHLLSRSSRFPELILSSCLCVVSCIVSKSAWFAGGSPVSSHHQNLLERKLAASNRFYVWISVCVCVHMV